MRKQIFTMLTGLLIGAALTGLQNDIRELQAAHALRLAGQEEPPKND